MLSGAEISRVVRQFIEKECRERQSDRAGPCLSAVTQKIEGEIEKFCNQSASLEDLTVSTCRERLGSLVWMNWEELTKRIKRKMPKMRKALIGPNPFEQTNGIPHRGLLSLIEFEIRDFKPPAVASAPPQPVEETPPVEDKIIWEQPLGLPGFQLTHIDEWQPVQTEIFLTNDGDRFRKTIDWSCWLRKNNDGSYTLFGRTTEAKKPPSDADSHVTFLLANGEISPQLKLVVLESGGIQLISN